MREQSSRHRFDALEENNRTIRSAVSSSARIKSAERAYPIDLAESEAAAAKYRAIAGGLRFNINFPRRTRSGSISAGHHRRHDGPTGAPDTSSDWDPARANPATPPAAPPVTASCRVVQPANATIATTFIGLPLQ
jgi:hypothetical protein